MAKTRNSSKRKAPKTKRKTKKKKAPKKKEKKMTQAELKEQIKENRVDLKNGITKEDLREDYWVEELKEYCSTNGLKASGKKTVLINRILNWHENPDEKGYKPRRRSRKRKRVAGDGGQPKKKQK